MSGELLQAVNSIMNHNCSQLIEHPQILPDQTSLTNVSTISESTIDILPSTISTIKPIVDDDVIVISDDDDECQLSTSLPPIARSIRIVNRYQPVRSVIGSITNANGANRIVADSYGRLLPASYQMQPTAVTISMHADQLIPSLQPVQRRQYIRSSRVNLQPHIDNVNYLMEPNSQNQFNFANEQASVEPSLVPIKATIDTSFKCPICGCNDDDEQGARYFADRESLEQHTIQMHCNDELVNSTTDTADTRVSSPLPPPIVTIVAQSNVDTAIDQGSMCDVCGRTFRDTFGLRRHRELHIKNIRYMCKYCDAVFGGPLTLREHYLRRHRELIPVDDLTALQIEGLMSQPDSDQIVTPQQQSSLVEIDPNDRSSLFMHQSIKRLKTTAPSNKCQFCGYEFPSTRALDQHINSFHDRKSPEMCEGDRREEKESNENNGATELIETQESKVYVKLEEVIESQATPTIDDDCRMDEENNLDRSDSYSILSANTTSDTSMIDSTPKKLTITPVSSPTMVVPSKNVASPVSREMVTDVKVEPKEEDILTPTNLSKTSARPLFFIKNLPSSARRAAVINRSIVIRKNGSTTCDICRRKLKNIYHLQRHRESHTDACNYVCGLCSRAYRGPYTLSTHLRQKHRQYISTDDIVHECGGDVVQRSVTSKLNGKMSAKSGVEPKSTTKYQAVESKSTTKYRRELCLPTDKKSARLQICLPDEILQPIQRQQQQRVADLSTRIDDLIRHTDATTSTCNFCAIPFANMSKLGDHIRDQHSIHAVDSDYPCHRCDRRFTKLAQLRVHLVNHPPIGGIPLPDNHCDICMRTVQHIAKHRELHLIADPRFECEQCHRQFGGKLTLADHVAECRMSRSTVAKTKSVLQHTNRRSKIIGKQQGKVAPAAVSFDNIKHMIPCTVSIEPMPKNIRF